MLFRPEQPLFSGPTPLKSDSDSFKSVKTLLQCRNILKSELPLLSGLAPLKSGFDTIESEERYTVQNYAKIRTFIYYKKYITTIIPESIHIHPKCTIQIVS